MYYIQYIKDRRYTSGDSALDMVRRPRARCKNTLFIQMFPPGSCLELKHYDIVALIALRDDDRGEELYSGYGSDYTTSNDVFRSQNQ